MISRLVLKKRMLTYNNIIETSVISSLDIALAAPRKYSFDFLDGRRKRSRNDKLQYYQHKSNNRVSHYMYSGREDDNLMYQCATLHIRK